jgi:hypothetical protein
MEHRMKGNYQVGVNRGAAATLTATFGGKSGGSPIGIEK